MERWKEPKWLSSKPETELWNIKYDEELCIKVIGCVWEVIFKQSLTLWPWLRIGAHAVHLWHQLFAQQPNVWQKGLVRVHKDCVYTVLLKMSEL